MRRIVVGFGILFLLAFSPIVSFCQPGGGGPKVPITGLEYLLIGGGAYGVSRLLKNRNKKSNES